MSPRIYLEETEDDEDQTGESKEDSKEEESGGGGGDASNPGSATFLALQMYARHCFVPAVRAIEALELEEEKKEGNDGMVATAGEGDESAKQTPNRRKTTASWRDWKTNYDDAFLNEVQSTVTHWITQIRKVTVLPASTPFPSGDSAETESHADWKSFLLDWFGGSTQTIRSELSKPDVLLTIALLKEAKRFVATIALENNTGMDAAEAHVGDVANFLRDWAKIGSAMDAVFTHLPKVRQSRFYDLDRLARLVEATTLNLRERMEGTLRESYKGNGIVLSLNYDEYEKGVAVKEFQLQLMNTVGQAVQKLQSKFTHKYESSSASCIATIRGIPPVSGKILWAKQMERQVHALMKRMSHVLGKEWGQHLEGRQLRRSCDELLSKLDSRAYFRNWVSEWERELSSDTNSKLNTFPIIIANFDEKHEYLSREIRYLKWLGYERDIPRTIALVSEEAMTVMLMPTALSSYAAARGLITEELEPLVSQEMRAIQESIGEAFDVSLDGSKKIKARTRWDSKDVGGWIAVLNEHVNRFEERSVSYEKQVFSDAVENVQKIVDELSMAGYSDLSMWVEKVNSRVGAVLGSRLEEALCMWSEAYGLSALSDTEKTKNGGKDSIKIPKISVEILLRNQEISAQPSLHAYMGIVCTLPRLNSGRFDVFASETRKEDTVEDHIRNLTIFVNQWLGYQTLWDSQVGDVASAVDGDLSKWYDLIVEASAARNTLDSTATVTEFGPISVRYSKVQSQVNLKYDSWQKELQTYFAAVLSERINESYEKVSSAKTRLESISLEGASVQRMRLSSGDILTRSDAATSLWLKKSKELFESEKLLKRQRHVFRGDWTEASIVMGQLQQVEQVLSKRTRTMEEQKAKIDQENLTKAKDALGLDAGVVSSDLSDCLDEIRDLTEVWEAVSKPYTALLDLKDSLWATAKLNVHVSFSELTIGMLWDNGLLDKKKDVAEVLSVAQGEMAIEIFLTKFVTNDHTGGLVLMRSSPYYRAVREFQEDGNLWEDRLTKLRAAFDAWIDVQRRWVYLEGIFFGSADIKAQLPAEWSRFKSVDGEFVSLMRRISSRPYAMEALNIENLQRTLERLQNLMVVIQKALGAYLEKQRNDFSRFYFLGDDDLLEIIGNASEPGKVLPHLGKMFASIATLNSVPCEDEGVLAKFDAMLSKDGEKVTLHSPIVVTDKMNVKEWLKQLEDDMKITLAKLLHSAVSEVQSTQTSTTSPEGKADFVNWANKFPAQVMILASQVDWSMSMDAALREAEILTEKLRISLSNASFYYGFEYLGIGERLVQTPLTDRCYLTLTQALNFRMGGNPFGPAGTGKTESVKALGAQLGRFVVVMNCDETFDFGAMGRIFCGFVKWVHGDVLTSLIVLRSVYFQQYPSRFSQFNKGYAGRSNLPDNLKTLFRSVAMVVPDRNLIAQVMLYSQGIVSAEKLASKVVDLFIMSQQKMSKQTHYDFGLRALKTLLVSAGGLKRKAMIGNDVLEAEELANLERRVLIQGACNNILPKLIAGSFPRIRDTKMENEELRGKIDAICKTSNYIPADQWVQKILQLKMWSGQVICSKDLMKGLEEEDGVKGELYMIDPKAIDKEALYGVLDGTTLEWTDGIFTSLLRTIIANQRGEADRRHWIVFDGDVDPEWAENLNSVLDDNKLLTLPSGERLSIPDNVRIILEVDKLRSENLSGDNNLVSGDGIPSAQISFLDAVQGYFVSEDSRSTPLVADALEFGLSETHIMDISREGLLRSLKSLVIKGIELAIEYDENHPDFPMTGQHMDNFAKRWVLHSSLWSFAGSASWDVRNKLADLLLRTSGMMLPSDNENGSLADYRVRVENGELELWSDSVPRMEIESHKVTATDVVVTTTDTVRHSDILGAWLESRSPLILCGPPGSGKTMTLTSVLQSVQGVTLASLNFSSRTTPEIIMKTFAQYCTYVRKGKDIVLEPVESLGAKEDSYGTQRVIMFMRQLVEQGGFWREDNVWVKTNRIQFVGACNPPTDAGRVVLLPSRDSLTQIYRTFNGGIMKLFPQLKGETDVITEAMIEIFTACQKKFTPQMQPQYFYSPRELSRWVRGIYEAVVHMDHGLTREELIRIWAHEALRLFSDRLVEHDEIEWCSNKIDEIARQHFAAVDHDEVLARPLFYSSWLTKDTRRVNREELKTFLSARLKVFYEEELDVPLVVFDQVLDHVLRIDRVLRQPMGIASHSRYGIDDFNEDLRGVMRRVGVDGEKICFIFDEGNVLGSGFLEAMNALLASGEVPGLFDGDEYTSLMSACRDSAARDGVIVDSEEELWRRFTSVVQRNLHVVFTMNPSGGEWKNRSTTSPALFNRCVVDWFGSWSAKAMAEVGREFTMRLDMGDAEAVGGSWGIGAGEQLMTRVEDAFDGVAKGGFHQAVVAALVQLHAITKELSEEAGTSASSLSRTFLSPRDYLALINNFVTCVNHRREEIEDEQLHVNAGLSKLKQTQENVAELKVGLASKTVELPNGSRSERSPKRKDEAEKMSVEVDKQQVAIAERKEKAQSELEEAEPALISARDSVKGIKKRDLDEVRNLARPPINVKLTLECVAIMLGEKKTDWADVKKMLAKKDFIPSILDFNVDNLTSRQIQIVREKYLDGNEDLSVEKVMRSSKACGPLYQWAESQIKYSTIYNSIQPLREEVEKLEQDAKVANDEKERLESEVAGLESSIANYKSEYATLIRDVEALKQEWKLSRRNLVGDGLQMAAFLTYAGFFPFSVRRTLLQQWRSALDDLGIEFREDLSMIESLSKASDRLEWQSQGLPSDSLSLENGVIISRCARFPLIIDPSGHAIDFMMKKYKDQKIQKTSFLDKSFMKEIQRTGGRSLVRIGTEDVDFSPKFNIILTTKNPAVKLTPDICSRVTLVNFTVTPAGLQSQSLTRILKNESPEVESQRNDILRLQGEQNVKLRGLEEQMLREISAVEGSILDDDRVVEGMERLMKEGAEVEEQMAKSAEVMTEVQRAISNVLESVLKRKEHHEVDDPDSRLALLKTALYREVASRIGRGLKDEDKMVFALLLAKLSTGKCALDEKKDNLATDDITSMIEEAFGSNFPWQGKGLNNLGMSPLMISAQCAPGHDVSGRVEAMAKAESKELAGVAMGSSEGYQIAENFIASASKRGTWVMLKNCHLCTDCEISPKLPTALLQLSDIIVAEAPTGIKASLSRFFSRISSDRFANSVQNRLYLIVGWTHAVIQERLRFMPNGWSQQYEFTEADAIHALDVIDSLVSDSCGKKQNVDPEKLPWEAIRTTLCKGVFGGRVTDDSDQDILDSLVNGTFVPDAFNVDFKLVDVDGAPTLPEGSSKDECFAWIDSLPSHNPPTWIGLDSAAETERDRLVAESVAKKYDDVKAALSDE
ncbi:dynein heavy chain [Skeletonema marinoi]|uniref:Dynein heavy chain n=1 Tax=Skeletonema marinoi TaxID=267567 RepID=A0AAD9DJ41_9STRA|nr:dynein heavy chain [Skeletonema marinoi]